MGTAIIVIVVALAAWNAVRMVGKQKKRMRDQACTGDCSTCKTPCEARKIYHIDKAEDAQQRK